MTITVTDSGTGNLIDSETITVTVNAAPVITSNGAGSIANVNVVENQTSVTTVTVNDPDHSANTLIYSIIGGEDQMLFTIDDSGVLNFNLTPNYETFADANHDGVYEVVVQVSDGNATDTQLIRITVIESNDMSIGAAVLIEVESEQIVDEVEYQETTQNQEVVTVDLTPENAIPNPNYESIVEELLTDQIKESTDEPDTGKSITEGFITDAPVTQPVGIVFMESVNSSNNSNKPVAIRAQLAAALYSPLELQLPSQLLIDPVQLLAEGVDFRDALDNLRENVTEENVQFELAIRTGTLLATGLSVGYIVWLVKGGVMAASLVTNLPLWRIIDPIPVLANMDDSQDGDKEDDESLESMLEARQEKTEMAANNEIGNANSSIDTGDIAP